MELREALKQYPRGVESMYTPSNSNLSSSTSGGKPSAEEANMARLRSISDSKRMEALATLKQSPDKALAIIDQIQLPDIKASALGGRAVGRREGSRYGKSILSKCFNALADLKNPEERLQTWLVVAEAAHRAKDEERARLAIDKGLSDAADLYKLDMDAEQPNTALREYWPSIQNYRRIVYRATKMYGVDAEAMLTKVVDPELNALATIEMARALLGRESRADSTMVSRTSRR
ncbi:MAG: hypothetical protein WKF37_16250 [Bryobacteraceae bacterium]